MIKKPALCVGQIWHGTISARRILAIEGTRVTWEPVGESGAKGFSTVSVQTFRSWAISRRVKWI